jgi:hypothetical protein
LRCLYASDPRKQSDSIVDDVSDVEAEKRCRGVGCPQVLADATLDETFVDAICEPSEVFSYGGMIAHVLTFAAHRRTLALGAFAKSGITDLGSGDPMQWVAEAA